MNFVKITDLVKVNKSFPATRKLLIITLLIISLSVGFLSALQVLKPIKRANDIIADDEHIRNLTYNYTMVDMRFLSKLINSSNNNQFYIRGFGLFIENDLIGLFKKNNIPIELMNRLHNKYLNDNSSLMNSKHLEKVTIRPLHINLFDFNKFNSYEEIEQLITTGSLVEKLHQVKKGENLWIIAQKNKISLEELIKANPNINPEKIQINQNISLLVPKPLITVQTTELQTYYDSISYEVEYIDNANMYIGEFSTKQKGTNGIVEIEAEIVKENGIPIESKTVILNQEIIKEPVPKIVYKGIKAPPPKIGTGSFAIPLSGGYITSKFGMRWGKLHKGIDIAVPTGTTVKASDGGKVIYAGNKGGYGLTIIIDHGERKSTLYAHNSKLLIKEGDMVFKGQTIAKSGNTGKSTGPHLHFEILIGDKAVDPLKYLPK